MSVIMDDRSIFAQFQHISNKLKKKSLLKKPNLSEIAGEFENLGMTCEVEDLPQYAGLCYKAAADCQKSLGNTSEEAFMLLKASRKFMLSYMKCIDNEMACTNEDLHEALACYRECVNSFSAMHDLTIPNIKPLLAGIHMEMANFMRSKLKMVEQAIDEYFKALNLLDKSPIEKIKCLQNLVSAEIELGIHDDALKYVNQIVQVSDMLPSCGFKKSLMQTSEITRIFLLLILEPAPQQMPSVLHSTLKKYASVEMVENNEMGDLQTTLSLSGGAITDVKLFLCLQSLIMTCNYSNIQSFNTLEIELLPYLNNDQKDLLRILIKKKLNI